jgi:chemotaxis signal transduction protein
MNDRSAKISSDEGREIIKNRAEKLSWVNEELDAQLLHKYLKVQMVDKEVYGIPYEHLEEIRQDMKITPVPGTKKQIVGVTNWRGRILTVASLASLLLIESEQWSAAPWVIVINVEGKYIGLLIDNVLGDENYNEETLAKSPAENSVGDSNFVLGIHEGNIAILNIVLIFQFCMLNKDR